MPENLLPDPGTPFGERVRRRLREELVIWLTTVGRDGTPQPNPVWFLWDAAGFLIYNRADAHRLVHLHRRPNVSLHFDSNGRGGDIVVFGGRAEVLQGWPLANEVPDYVRKYREAMERVQGSQEAFGASYPVAMRVELRWVRGS